MEKTKQVPRAELYKSQAALLDVLDGMGVREAARQHDITPTVISTLRKNLRENGDEKLARAKTELWFLTSALATLHTLGSSDKIRP